MISITRQAAQQETTCYVYHQQLSEVLVIKQAAKLISVLFKQCEDLYSVNENYTWTYVVTYERDFDSYFSHIKIFNFKFFNYLHTSRL